MIHTSERKLRVNLVLIIEMISRVFDHCYDHDLRYTGYPTAYTTLYFHVTRKLTLQVSCSIYDITAPSGKNLKFPR